MPTTKRGYNGVAVAMIVFDLLAFTMIRFDAKDHYYSYPSFWISIAAGLFLAFWLIASSYRKDRRGYTERDLAHVRSTFRSLAFMRDIFGFIILTIIVVNLVQAHNSDPSPILMGAFPAFTLLFSASILLDNRFKLGIFAWNSQNSQMRALYRTGVHNRKGK